MRIRFLGGSEREIAHLSGANLREANLRNANLLRASLSGTNLRDADLRHADLRIADLRDADLRIADLRNADLRNADLRCADLRVADLRDADLRHADLRHTDLRDADLRDANLSDALLPHFQVCPAAGSFRAFKLVCGEHGTPHVIEIEIARSAQRTNSLIGRKCRASKVRVLPGQRAGMSPTACQRILYAPGAIIEVEDFDPDIRIECTRGIHFFMTRREAEEYNG